MEKINVLSILKAHLETLKNDNTGKPDFSDYLIFALIPIILASLLVYNNVQIQGEITSIIVTTLAIFVGLMLNVIVIIFDISKRDSENEIKNIILKQLLANISFEILLALFSILNVLGSYSKLQLVSIIFSWVSFCSLTLFLITLLMILKRLNKVFTFELEQ